MSVAALAMMSVAFGPMRRITQPVGMAMMMAAQEMAFIKRPKLVPYCIMSMSG